MKKTKIDNLTFKNQKNKFRGLVSEVRSRKFVKGENSRPSMKLRSGMRKLLLIARDELQPCEFDIFLDWINRQIQTRLADVSRLPMKYEDLSGVFTRAPIVSLERELLWITARIKADAPKLSVFRFEAMKVEQLAFTGKIEEAIETLKTIEHTFGSSLWSVQLRIALEQMAGGLERQKRYTAELRAVHKRGLLGFIAYHTSVRNEERSTFLKYCDDIGVRIEKQQYYDQSVKTYARYRLIGEWPTSKIGFADVLRVEQSHSFIDVYETFVAVAQEIVRREDFVDVGTVLVRCLGSLTCIDDFRLRKSAQAIDGRLVVESFGRRDTQASNALFNGKVKLATRLARNILDSSTVIDAWQYIYAGVAWSHATRSRPVDFRYPKDIPRVIGGVLSRSVCHAGSFAQLEKFANNLRGLPASVAIIDFLPLLRRPRPDDVWRPWLIGLNCSTIGIEDLPPNAYQHLADKINKPMDATEMVWRMSHGDTMGCSVRSHVSTVIFTAAGFISQGEFSKAIETLLDQEIEQVPESLRLFTTSILLHAYFGLGDRKAVIELIADDGSRCGPGCQLLPVLPALEHYQWPDYKEVTAPLSASIALHLLWSANDSDATASLLRFAAGKVIRASGVGLPSKLMDSTGKYPPHQLVYFLKEVCVPKILDVARILKSSREVFEERQAICAGLRRLDAENADTYQDEVMAISNQLALDEGKWIVDRTRVHVDSDALSKWAAKEFSDDYSRYRDLLLVTVGASQNFDDVLKELSMSAPSRRTNFTPENESDAVLVSILSRFGDEFLNNPSFGLDFYLSKRIRHQSFIGLIRGPLEFQNLITTRESESGGYHRNEFWLNKFSCLDPYAKETLNSAFTRFSTKFDETLISAKDTKFHLWSQEKQSGLLYLDISPQLITLARAIVRMDTKLSDFIATIISLLWASLEPSLAEVRRYVSDDLKIKISSAFDELRANARNIAEQDPEFLNLDLAIGRSSTDVQRALDDVSAWFSHPDIEVHKRNFNLDQIVNIAIDSVLKCQRSFEPEIHLNIEGDCEMPSSNLVFVHDVLFVALDNVRNHSGIKNPKVKITVVASIVEETLTIEVDSESKMQNRLKHEEVLREIRQLIDGGKVGPRTRREGRSGILKLATVVRQSSKGRIDYGFTENEQFHLKITYSLVVL